MALAAVAWAQVTPADARKPYIRCAAVYGVVAERVKEPAAKEAYTDLSTLFTLWASELEAGVPPKEAMDTATRELGLEIQLMAVEMKRMGNSEAARQRFRQSLAQEAKDCKAFYDTVSKVRSKKEGAR